MSTEDWIPDKNYPLSSDNPYEYTVLDVYRLHGDNKPGSIVLWFDAQDNKWWCGICGPESRQFELPGDTHEERCALATVITRMES